MSRWVKLGLPLGIAAVLLVALAVGFQTPGSDAATCNGKMNTSGGVSPGNTASYTMTFCSNPADGFQVYLLWGSNKYDPSKDLALRVTSPSGQVFLTDTHDSASEVFFASPPLAEGNWQVEVVNVGGKRVNYSIWMSFG